MSPTFSTTSQCIPPHRPCCPHLPTCPPFAFPHYSLKCDAPRLLSLCAHTTHVYAAGCCTHAHTHRCLPTALLTMLYLRLFAVTPGPFIAAFACRGSGLVGRRLPTPHPPRPGWPQALPGLLLWRAPLPWRAAAPAFTPVSPCYPFLRPHALLHTHTHTHHGVSVAVRTRCRRAFTATHALHVGRDVGWCAC